MRIGNPVGFSLLALALPIIALHILRPRRRAVTVASTFLWKRIERPVSSASPWQKLRPSWLFAAQLLAVALLALVVARPERVRPAPLAQHTVFVIDASGSMAATDGSPDRLADAKDRVRKLRRELPEGGIASIVVAGARARVALTASASGDAFDAVLRGVTSTAGPPDIEDAFTLAASLDNGDVPTGIVLVSDGGLTTEERSLVPPGTRYERIGSRATNRAISRVSTEPRGSGQHVRVEVRNTGGPRVRQPLRVDVDGRTAATGDLELGGGAISTFEADVPAGQRIEAFLDGTDLLATDDRGVAVSAQRRTLRVFLAGDDRFIGQLLAVIPGIEVERGSAGLPTTRVDVAIYSGVAVPNDLAVPFLAIAPPGGIPEVTVSGSVERPSVTVLRSDESVLHGLDLTDVAIAGAQRINAPAATTLVGSVDTPLLVTGTRTNRPFTYLGFSLSDSNLALQVAFPVLGDRLLAHLAGTDPSASGLTVGAVIPLDRSVTTLVQAPDGTVITVRPGDPPPMATRPGFWTLSVEGRPDALVAVNPSVRESVLEPLAQLDLTRDPLERAPNGGSDVQSLLVPFALGLLAILLGEFFLARRANAVPRRQWRASVILRGVVAALILVALVGPVLRRPANGLATVFVVDGSASLGAGGRDDATEFVRQAMTAKPADARAGVVVFGGDARVDRMVRRDISFSRPEVKIDQRATNLATALRLGAAVVPSDARRRIVLVSDGRATRGETGAALDDTVELRIPVDTKVVGTVGGSDVAVTAVKGPPLARQGDAVTVTATLASNVSTPVEVTLERDGTAVVAKVVDLTPAGLTVLLPDAKPPASGLARYRVRVRAAVDTVADNDAASVGVPIEGPARVLIAEGSVGEGRPLADALSAGGLQVERMAATDLPGLDELGSFTSIVLVNVDARTLPPEQIDNLTRAVRDLGRGLVTVGGPRSFGVGGYRDSALEELLPVISDVTDPLRRQTVAEVLSIDTSGSMAACHCREGTNGLPMGANRIAGGATKVDIAKAAAARTVSALSETDQIGIIAFNENAKWILPLGTNPGVEAVVDDLGKLQPAGGTFLPSALGDAAKSLESSNAALKHIILFTDGFTAPGDVEKLEAEAKLLNETKGITVSVLATGEGAAPALEKIAVAGNGRFYLGGDLSRIPQIMAEEAVMASRNFVNEGVFLPEVVSSNAIVRNLTASPELLGYVATTSKPTALTLLRIGPERDPLLATWQAGLGRSTAWTSDTTPRWSRNWVGWDGFVGFWTQVVKDTFPVSSAGAAVQGEAVDGRLKVTLAATTTFPDGATATARIVGPDGRTVEVPLGRADATTFTGEAPIDGQGIYAVGATAATATGETLLTSTGLATQAYAPEFRPGAPDAETLAKISAATGGRANVDPKSVWDTAGLRAGRRVTQLRGPLLLLAALLWPIAVALSRIVTRSGALRPIFNHAGPSRRRTTAGSVEPSAAPVPAPMTVPSREPSRETATVNRLLARKRGESPPPTDPPS